MTEFAVGDEVYYTPKIGGAEALHAEQHVADVHPRGAQAKEHQPSGGSEFDARGQEQV